MTRDLNCTQFQGTVGLSMYTLGFALTPLVTASFSEEFGRQPLYLVSCLGFAMMHLVVALYASLPPFIPIAAYRTQRDRYSIRASGTILLRRIWLDRLDHGKHALPVISQPSHVLIRFRLAVPLQTSFFLVSKFSAEEDSVFTP